MAGKAKSKQEEALQFLDDLDSFDPPPGPASAAAPASATVPAAGEEEVYAFIDEITQKSSAPPRSSFSHIDRPPSRAGTPTLRKYTGERVKVGAAPVPLLPTSGSTSPVPPLSRTASPISRTPSSAAGTPALPPAKFAAEQKQDAPASGGGWGWGSVWNSASAAIQQARSVVDEQVKNLPKNEQARKWGEGVLEYAKAAHLDKISQCRATPSPCCTSLLIVPVLRPRLQACWIIHIDRPLERRRASHFRTRSHSSLAQP